MDVGKLEQAIRADPEGIESYLVYGDWLEAQGDPRGELIAVQAKRAALGHDDDALFLREHELIAANERTWLGELLYTERRAHRLFCTWHLGFLREVTMFRTSPELFEALAECPAAKFLRRLAIRSTETPSPHAREFGPLCELDLPVDEHPPAMTAEVRRAAEAAMTATRNEAAMENAWDHDFRANPYHPWSVCQKELAKVEYLPYLIEQLAVEGEPSHWARYALEKLERRASGAADALVTHQCWLELWCVAPERAESLGVHLRMPMRAQICDRLLDRSPRAAAAHLVDLLASDDPEILQWALDGAGYSDRSHLEKLTREHPRLVPVTRLRQLLEHPNAEVRNHAASRLVELRFPEHADAVIDAIITGRAKPRPSYEMWLGSHPKSDQLLAFCDKRQAFHIQRRRRCAGLPTTLEELDDPGSQSVFTLEHADDLYVKGKLDDPTLSDHGALGSYARVLIREPHNAAAAFRVAWIERGFGALITEHRVAWLRSLGVSEDALARLAKPPSQVVPGYGWGERIHEPKPLRAAAALAAGLPSLAYWYLPENSPEAAAARDAAKLQLPTLC